MTCTFGYVFLLSSSPQTDKIPIIFIRKINFILIPNFIFIQQLDGQGRARREAARRRKSECKINLGPR